MATVAERLVKVRTDGGYNRKNLAEKLGLPYRTVTNYENGSREPGHSYIIKVAKLFGVSTDYILGITDDPHGRKSESLPLSSDAVEFARRYDQLDQKSKAALCGILDCLTDSTEQPAPDRKIYLVPSYLQPVSAGGGEWNDDSLVENLHLIKEPPRGTAYVVRVHGDSMEPIYHDGERVFVRVQDALGVGEVGIFTINGDMYIKVFRGSYLESYNRDYPNVPLTESARCQGKVIGVCDDTYFEK